MLKRMIAGVMTFIALLCFTIESEAADSYRNNKDTWLIYLYLCGSNLESDSRRSTKDIADIQQVQLPLNVKILIAAGGAKKWYHPTIKDGGDGIYLYSSKGLEKLADLKGNMGAPETLEKFLKFGEEKIKFGIAEKVEPVHKVLIFRDHGGINGICYDENYKNDRLTYKELNKAFSEVYGDSPNTPPLELIGFGACLTGSYELANTVSNFSHYMLGSESTEYGWYFMPVIAELAKDTSINGAKLGKFICDSAINNYDETTKLTNTFSVIDLTKMPKLRETYEKYFAEALRLSNRDKTFCGAFARAASARNVDKYSNIYLDLGLLAKNTETIMPKVSKNLYDAINNAVVYNKHGAYIESKGIAANYPYFSTEKTTQIDDKTGLPTLEGISKYAWDDFLNQKYAPQSQKDLYKKILELNVDALKNIPFDIDSNNNAFIKLQPEQLANVSTIDSVIVPLEFSEKSDDGLSINAANFLFSADDLKIDWKNGIVTEKFRAVQPFFDEHPITIRSTISGRDHNFYEVPILLNGKPVNLQVRYDISDKKYSIIGVGSTIENGMVRVNHELNPGDIITPTFFVAVNEDSLEASKKSKYFEYKDRNGEIVRGELIEGVVQKVPIPDTEIKMAVVKTLGEPFVYTQSSTITNKRIKDGIYQYGFSFISPNGDNEFSSALWLVVQNGKVVEKWTQEYLELLKKLHEKLEEKGVQFFDE